MSGLSSVGAVVFLAPFVIGSAIFIFGWASFIFLNVAAVPLSIFRRKSPKAKRVLIVEDDVSMKIVLEEIVRSASPFAIIDASDSQEEAQKLMYEGADIYNDFDFVVADIFLKGPGTGVDLWKQSRDLHTPFLFASAIDEKAFNEMVEGPAIYDPKNEKPVFLQKPIDPVECISLIKRAMGE